MTGEDAEHVGLPGFVCDCGEPLENFEIVDESTSRCPNCGETYGK